jgi:hypothetical protein
MHLMVLYLSYENAWSKLKIKQYNVPKYTPAQHFLNNARTRTVALTFEKYVKQNFPASLKVVGVPL